VSIERDLDRGARAERTLKDLEEPFALVESHILGMFRTAPLRDDDGVIRTKQLLHCLTLVRSALEQAVRDGKIAANTLEEQKRGVRQFLGDVWHSRLKR
jgi:hypothetical protein